MEPPALNARTDALVSVVPQVDLDGGIVMVVVIKARYRINEDGSTSPSPDAEIRHVDVPGGDEGKSVKYPADVCIRKRGTDVVVVGHAMAPGSEPVRELDCLVRVGPVQRSLRVFGPRVWYRGVAGVALTPPETFTNQALIWESAFGGTDVADDRLAREPRNPIGRGMAVDEDTLVHTMGPSIEDPEDLITSHRSRPTPAGVAPLPSSFEPRASYAGTMDQRWQDEWHPLMPRDFDERFNQVAAPSMIADPPLRGREPVRVLNMHPDGPLSFELPVRSFFVGGELDGALVPHRATLDTVLLEPSDRRFELVWRAAIPAPRPLRRLRMIQVHDRRVLA